MAKKDNVNHPKHYTSDPSGIECIDITRHRNFNVGNAIYGELDLKLMLINLLLINKLKI